jgi:hypothetical protein
VLWAVFGPPPDVRFEDVAAVEEGHFAVGLDPELVPGVGGEDGEGGDVEAEFEGFGEFAWGGLAGGSRVCVVCLIGRVGGGCAEGYRMG